MVDALGASMVIVILPLYVAAVPSPAWLGAEASEAARVGVLIAAFGLALALAQSPAGRLSDHLERRRLFIVVGLVALAGIHLLYLSASTYLELLGIRVIQGIGVALTIPASVALIRGHTRLTGRGNAMGIYTTFRMIGFAVGPPVGGLLHQAYSFEGVFWTAACLSGLAAVLARMGLPERARSMADPTPADDGTPEPPVSAGTGPAADRPSLELPPEGGPWPLGHVPVELLVLGTAMTAMATNVAMMSALENEFNARLDQTPIAFGLAFSALIVTRLVLQVPAGRLSDRIGRKPLILAGLLLLGPASALMGHVVSTTQLIGIRAIQGVATAGIAGPTLAMAADKARGGRAAGEIGVVTQSFGWGIVLGPLLAGFMASGVGFASPFWVGGGLCILTALLVGARTTETVE